MTKLRFFGIKLHPLTFRLVKRDLAVFAGKELVEFVEVDLDLG